MPNLTGFDALAHLAGKLAVEIFPLHTPEVRLIVLEAATG
jgi:hypothetical protein